MDNFNQNNAGQGNYGPGGQVNNAGQNYGPSGEMNNAGQNYSVNGQANGAGYGNYPSNYSGDFESQFKNMVAMPVENVQAGVVEKKPKDRSVMWIIVMAVVAGVGLVATIWILISYLGVLGDIAEDEELKVMTGAEEQDDMGEYKDLRFSEDGNSDAPLLVYSAVKDGSVVDMNWLEEFRDASARYTKEYGGTAISNTATFNNVMISDVESRLYPYMPLKRFLVASSEGCERFDFYENLLVIADYEHSGQSCEGAEWNILTSSANVDD